MLIIPAIDLKDGRCVRLRQGLMDAETVFSDDPVQVAARWVEADAATLDAMHKRLADHLAKDGDGALAYLAPSRSHLELTAERFPNAHFHAIREQAG